MNKSRTNSWIALFSVSRRHGRKVGSAGTCLVFGRQRETTQSPFCLPQKGLLTPHTSAMSLMQCTFQAFIVSLSLHSGITMQDVIRLWLLAPPPACSHRPLTVWHGSLPPSLPPLWLASSEVSELLHIWPISLSGHQDVHRRRFGGGGEGLHKFKPKKKPGVSRTGLAWEGQIYEAIMTWEPEICPLLTMFIKSITSFPSCLEAIQTKTRKEITNGGKTWN